VNLAAVLVIKGNRGSSNPGAGAPFRSVPVSYSRAEIFGKSVLERFVDRLQLWGIHTTAIADRDDFSPRKSAIDTVNVESAGHCNLALKRVLDSYSKRGVSTALVAEIGSYTEFDLRDAVNFHRARKAASSQFHYRHESTGYSLVDLHRIASMSSDEFMKWTNGIQACGCPSYSDVYDQVTYANRLKSAHDVRQLVVDGFLGRCEVFPQGREVKPGVWVQDGTRLHRGARLVAPVYIGAGTRVGRGAVVTRFSNLESNCRIGEESVVANTSVLPGTVVGAGLDFCHAVIRGSEFSDIRRNICFEIEDPALIASASRQHRAAFNNYHGYDSRPASVPEFEYSRYFARAAGRFLEAFRGEA
jgi:NDP-sugar pyrophosphorylase family protein